MRYWFAQAMQVSHIYWFSYFSNEEPSVRYRAVYPLRHLQEHYGIGHTMIYPGYTPAKLLRFFITYLGIVFFRKKNSVLVVQKLFTRGLYATALKLLVRLRPENTLYDVDDAEYTRRPADTMHFFMKHCSACAAGSESLMEYIRGFGTPVFLQTSPVIAHRYSRHEVSRTFTVGWIGYYGAHRKNLHTLLFPALQQLKTSLTLKILGVKNEEEKVELFQYFKDDPHIVLDIPLNINWHDEEAVYQHLSGIDVGTAPLLDTEFNRAKSAFKLKQFLSCGVPVLASSVGENRRFLLHGTNGYFCDSPEEYLVRLEQIHRLKGDEYSRMSGSAWKTREIFSIPLYCRNFLEFYHDDRVRDGYASPAGLTAPLPVAT